MPDAFDAIRPVTGHLWQAYRDASTPWPSDAASREQLIAMRRNCDQADLEALQALPPSVSRERAIAQVKRRLNT